LSLMTPSERAHFINDFLILDFEWGWGGLVGWWSGGGEVVIIFLYIHI
jgi:hypothetical protein